jgi:hypothetical protein
MVSAPLPLLRILAVLLAVKVWFTVNGRRAKFFAPPVQMNVLLLPLRLIALDESPRLANCVM